MTLTDIQDLVERFMVEEGLDPAQLQEFPYELYRRALFELVGFRPLGWPGATERAAPDDCSRLCLSPDERFIWLGDQAENALEAATT